MIDLSYKIETDVFLYRGKCLFLYGVWVEHEREDSDLFSGIMYLPHSNINSEEFESSEETERFCIVWDRPFHLSHSYVGLKKQQVREMFNYFKENDSGEDKTFVFRLKDGMSFEEFCLVSRLTKI